MAPSREPAGPQCHREAGSARRAHVCAGAVLALSDPAGPSTADREAGILTAARTVPRTESLDKMTLPSRELVRARGKQVRSEPQETWGMRGAGGPVCLPVAPSRRISQVPCSWSPVPEKELSKSVWNK